MKQYSSACDENREPILSVIAPAFAATHRVLEIGSGTGQHAAFFASQLLHLQWQPSDLEENHPSILAWRDEANLANLLPPLVLDVTTDQWPERVYDGLFSANTAHIMAWPAVEQMFAGIGRVLSPGAHCCLYGPFNYGGKFTSDSNRRFDEWLKARDPDSGVRDFEAIAGLAQAAGLRLIADNTMPVNNRLLVWKKADAA